VINGSELGKEHSAKAILEKCGLNQNLALLQKISPTIYSADNSDKNQSEQKQSLEASRPDTHELLKEIERGVERTLEELLRAMPMDDYIPYELKLEKKQKHSLRQYLH
jgi:hypothetical protein